MTYNFPTFATAYPGAAKRKGRLKISKQLRYKLACSKYNQQIDKFVYFINENSAFVHYATAKRELALSLITHYTTKHKNVESRLTAMMIDLRFVQAYLPGLTEEEEYILAKMHDDYSIKLKVNYLNSSEGVLHIGVYQGNKKLYFATFSIGYDNNIIIGSIQGANGKNSQGTIKSATKALFGLRPQQLLIWVLLDFANILKFNKVEAVSNDNHPSIKLRHKLKNKRPFIADYDQIWSSYHGTRLSSGNWEIPPMHLKPMVEIASKKRSMYRKRYAMLDNIHDSMASALNQNRRYF